MCDERFQPLLKAHSLVYCVISIHGIEESFDTMAENRPPSQFTLLSGQQFAFMPQTAGFSSQWSPFTQHQPAYDSKLHGALPIEKERTQWCQENKQNSALFNFIQWNKSREERLTDLCARNTRFLPTLPSLTKGIFHVIACI